MLLAFVLGAMLAVVGITLIRQWLNGALNEETTGFVLTPAQFPHLAPPSRVARAGARVRARSGHLGAPGLARRAA